MTDVSEKISVVRAMAPERARRVLVDAIRETLVAGDRYPAPSTAGYLILAAVGLPATDSGVQTLAGLLGAVLDDMARVHGPDSRSVRAALAELDRAVAR